MSTIAEQLTALQAVKNGLKNALIANGADMSDVTFSEYPEKVQEKLDRWVPFLSGTAEEVDFTGLPGIRMAVCAQMNTLKTVIIPDNITAIPTAAFSSCVNLKNVIFSNNLLSIGTNAFNNCKSLTDVVLPDSVIEIWVNTFLACTALKRMVIGTSINNMRDNAIGSGSDDCPTTLIVKSVIPPQITTTSIGGYVTRIVVPRVSITDYISATNWAALTGRFESRLAVHFSSETGKVVVDSDILDGDVSGYLYRAKDESVLQDDANIYYYTNDITPFEDYEGPNGVISFINNPDREVNES